MIVAMMKWFVILGVIGLGFGEVTEEPLSVGDELNSQTLANLGINTSYSKIELREMGIKSVQAGTFESLGELTLLDLSKNKISRLEANTFVGLARLKSLDLSDNQIAFIDPLAFKGLRSLFGLDLSRNQIGSIQPGTFSGMTKLDYLVLSGNKLKSIEPKTLDGLRSLKLLSLFSNPIEMIDVDTVNSICLEEILMENVAKDRFFFVHNNKYCLKIKYLNVTGDELKPVTFKKRNTTTTMRVTTKNTTIFSELIEPFNQTNETAVYINETKAYEIEETEENVGERNVLLTRVLESIAEYNRESKHPVILTADELEKDEFDDIRSDKGDCKLNCIVSTILRSIKDKFNVNIFNFNLK